VTAPDASSKRRRGRNTSAGGNRRSAARLTTPRLRRPEQPRAERRSWTLSTIAKRATAGGSRVTESGFVSTIEVDGGSGANDPTEGERSELRVRQRRGSFMRLVLPLAFPRGRFEERCRMISQQSDDKGRLLWELADPSLNDFLPHVRHHLNRRPTSSSGPGDMPSPEQDALGFVWQLQPKSIDSVLLRSDSWQLCLPQKEGRKVTEVRFRITDAYLAVFRPDICFGVIHVTPRSFSVASWFDLLHFLRFYGPRAKALTLSGGGRRYKMADLIGPVVSSALLENERLSFAYGSQAAAANASGRPPTDPVRYAKDLFVPGEMLVFSSLFLDGVTTEQKPELLARVRGGFHSLQDVRASSGGHDNRDWLVPYRDGQQFVLSIQGSAFVAFDAGLDQFTNDTLPDHLEKTYFVMFLLVLVQRFALTEFSEQVVWITPRTSSRSKRGALQAQLDRVVNLERQLLEFTGRCFYLQVSQGPDHHLYYDRLRNINQVEGLYREVKEEVGALRNYVDSLDRQERERRASLVQVAVMVITAIFFPAGVLLALFAGKVNRWPGVRTLSPASTMWITLGALVALVMLILLLQLWLGGQRSSRSGPKRKHRTGGVAQADAASSDTPTDSADSASPQEEL